MPEESKSETGRVARVGSSSFVSLRETTLLAWREYCDVRGWDPCDGSFSREQVVFRDGFARGLAAQANDVVSDRGQGGSDD